MRNQDFINQFCEQHSITSYEVDLVNLHQAFHIKWKGNLGDFLNIVQQNGIKHIFTDVFRPNYKLIESEVKELGVDPVSPNYDNTIDLLSRVQAYDGIEIVTKVLAKIEGSKIVFEEYSDQSAAFFSIYDNFERIKEEVKVENRRRPSAEWEVRQEEIKPFAIQLAEHPKFESNRLNNTELKALLDHILKDKDWLPARYVDDRKQMAAILKWQIRDMAKAHFKMVLEPEMDTERIKKIKAWRSEKMSKVEMASRLGVSKSKLNQLYYQTE